MEDKKLKWLLKNKLVCDFRGFPIGTVKKVWFEDESGPMVIVERQPGPEDRDIVSWEAIPFRSIQSVDDTVRLKPPSFAE